jgi:hypothetical protein
MMMIAVFDDGSYIVGDRKWYYPPNESPGTHHLKVTKSFGIDSMPFEVDHLLDGKRVAIPITKPKYWVIG